MIYFFARHLPARREMFLSWIMCSLFILLKLLMVDATFPFSIINEMIGDEGTETFRNYTS